MKAMRIRERKLDLLCYKGKKELFHHHATDCTCSLCFSIHAIILVLPLEAIISSCVNMYLYNLHKSFRKCLDDSMKWMLSKRTHSKAAHCHDLHLCKTYCVLPILCKSKIYVCALSFETRHWIISLNYTPRSNDRTPIVRLYVRSQIVTLPVNFNQVHCS